MTKDEKFIVGSKVPKEPEGHKERSDRKDWRFDNLNNQVNVNSQCQCQQSISSPNTPSTPLLFSKHLRRCRKSEYAV